MPILKVYQSGLPIAAAQNAGNLATERSLFGDFMQARQLADAEYQQAWSRGMAETQLADQQAQQAFSNSMAMQRTPTASPLDLEEARARNRMAMQNDRQEFEGQQADLDRAARLATHATQAVASGKLTQAQRLEIDMNLRKFDDQVRALQAEADREARLLPGNPARIAELGRQIQEELRKKRQYMDEISGRLQGMSAPPATKPVGPPTAPAMTDAQQADYNRRRWQATGGTRLPTVASDADYEAIPPGTVFVDPQGNTRQKPR